PACTRRGYASFARGWSGIPETTTTPPPPVTHRGVAAPGTSQVPCGATPAVQRGGGGLLVSRGGRIGVVRTPGSPAPGAIRSGLDARIEDPSSHGGRRQSALGG